MIPLGQLGVKGQQQRALIRAMSDHHTKRIHVSSLDTGGDVVDDLTDAFYDGSVDVAVDADATRGLDLTLFDPRHRIRFDGDSWGGGALDLSRMLRVRWQVNHPLLTDPVSVPVFTGPAVTLERDGPFVHVRAQGKETFGLGASWRVMTIPKGTRKTTAIRRILEERMGETRLAIPDLPTRLPKNVTLARTTQPWKVARRIARSMNRELYYDGAGTARLRKPQDDPAWSFYGDVDNADVLTRVKVTADKSRLKNAVIVTGGKPKGRKTPVVGRAVADRTHPLSPWRLGPPNAPLYLVHESNNPKVRSRAEADRRAERLLKQHLRLHTDAEFDALPNPLLDPFDLVHVSTDYESVDFYLKSFQLPLGTGNMSVGYWKNPAINRRWRVR